MARHPRFWIVSASILGLLAASASSAEPLDLSDRRPRAVEVRFELSPKDQPGTLDTAWGAYRRGQLAPTPDGAVIEIRLPSSEVEAMLREAGTRAVPGTFSEFVWRIDPATGHVLRAELRGRVREELRLGPFRTDKAIDIEVEMTTVSAGGYRSDQGVLGIQTHHFCRPEVEPEPCLAVAPVRYDPRRGYVNAVGSVRAATPLAEVRAFSPLGEAEFREIATERAAGIVSGSRAAEAVCSALVDRPCLADLGGES